MQKCLTFIVSIMAFLMIHVIQDLYNKFINKVDKDIDFPMYKDIIEFNEWQKSVGIFTLGIGIKGNSQGMNGLYAIKDLDKGTLIADIPITAMITEDFYTDDPIILKAMRTFHDNKLLAIILYQEMKNPHSRFKPYFKLYPKDVSNFPLFYDDTEELLSRGTSFNLDIKFYRIDLDRYYNEVKSILQLNITKRELYTYYTYASSRCLILTLNGRRQYSLVPIFDMMNAYPTSKPEHNSVIGKLKYNHGVPHLHLTTTRRLKAGEEILYLYEKTYTNTNYLINYGFIFKDINDTTLQVKIPYKKINENTELKKRILNKLENVFIWEKEVIVVLSNTSNENY